MAEVPGSLEDAPRPGSSPTPGAAGGKDRLLDLVRITAIGRVVLWHTWSWAWLTWIPAMPAMFFVTGALLEGSVARRGWRAMLGPRLRRLLVPYWVYAAACWVVMVIDGWRPTLGDAAKWAVPLLDPVGSDRMPGLWVPLWYLRAYLWFLLAAGILRVIQRRLGALSVVLSAAASLALWWAARRGLDVPFAVGDAVTYLPFVLAGMQYWSSRRLPRRSVLVALAAASAVAAVVVWQRYGPADGVVNRSYLLTMLVGLAGVSAVFALRDPILRATSRGSTVIGQVNSRALTIYLWQGFGLVAAQRLVDERLDPSPYRAALALVVVVAVIVAAVALFGFVEDLAAGRRRPGEGLLGSALAVTPSRSLAVLPGLALLVVALVWPLQPNVTFDAPLSGQAVVARGGLVAEDLARPSASVDVSGLTPQEALDGWVADEQELLARIGTDWIDAAIARPDGTIEHVSWNDGDRPTDTIAWWSMTKAVTAGWMLRLVDEGVVSIDDRLSDHVPETPRADDMTLEQLARHTSGIPPELDGHLFDADPAAEIDAFIEQGQLAFEPGAGYGYSRVGYYLLALALERASGHTWQEAVSGMADEAGVELEFDDDGTGPVTDPDGHGYRGGLWSSGAVVSRVSDGAAFVRWLYSDGLSERAVDLATRFPADEERRHYGLGLLPLCPCRADGDWIDADRFGLDSATGAFAVDPATDVAVMIRPEGWWTDTGPATEFYDLQQRLLDSVT